MENNVTIFICHECFSAPNWMDRGHATNSDVSQVLGYKHFKDRVTLIQLKMS
jgi:hypothetical protein